MTKKTKCMKKNADMVFQRVKKICEEKGFLIIEEDEINRRFKANSGWSAFSWGETMDIIVSQQAEGSTVTIESKPDVWFNLPAARKAKNNIESIFNELDNNE